MEVLGLPALARPGQGPRCCGSGVGSVPCSSLSLQTRQTLTRDPWLLCHQRGLRGVAGVQFSTCFRSKERRREGAGLLC